MYGSLLNRYAVVFFFCLGVGPMLACEGGDDNGNVDNSGGVSGSEDAMMMPSVDAGTGGTIGRGKGPGGTGGTVAVDGGDKLEMDAAPLCAENEKRCQGVVPETCTGGQWVAGQACEFACTAGDCTGECADMATRCNDKTPQTCVGNQWVGDQTCEFACSEGQCTGVCANDAKQCVGLMPQTCVDHAWQDGNVCQYACAGGNCTGECSNNSRQCNNKTPELCVANQWQAQSECPFACVNGSCTGQCNDGDKQCNGLVPQTCGNNQWNNGNACQFVCLAGDCTGVCTPASVRCGANGGIETCSNAGQWVAGDPCPFGCQGGACFGECTNGARRCAGGVQPQSCVGNFWQNATAVARQLVVNPDFAQGTTGWDTNIQDYALISDWAFIDAWKAHSDTWSIWFGGLDDVMERGWQVVSVPQNVLTAQLTFWYQIGSDEMFVGPFDPLAVYVGTLNPTSFDTPVAEFHSEDATTDGSFVNAGTWVSHTVNLSAQMLAGRDVPILFDLVTDDDSGTYTSYLIDDVTLNVTLCE